MVEALAAIATEREGPWPNSGSDLDGIVVALARIQTTYMLPTDELAAGMLRGRQFHARLSWRDCVFVAEHRLSGKFPVRAGITREFAVAYEWLETALR